MMLMIFIPRARSSMDRASDSGSECWGFESLRACQVKKVLKPFIPNGFRTFSLSITGHGKWCPLPYF